MRWPASHGPFIRPGTPPCWSKSSITFGCLDAERFAAYRMAKGHNSRSPWPLNLEDAFIEYTRGPRRAVPAFVTENRDVESIRA